MNIADTLLHNLFGDHYTDANKNTWYWNEATGSYTMFPAQMIDEVIVTAPPKKKGILVNILPGAVWSESKKVNGFLIAALIIAAGVVYYLIKFYKK